MEESMEHVYTTDLLFGNTKEVACSTQKEKRNYWSKLSNGYLLKQKF